jgi:putative ABC transport system permease protein
LEDDQLPGLVVEVLHVEHCPNFPAALALVQRVIAELGVDAEVRTTMIGDQAAAERARRRDIVAQFLTEATALSILGGLLGVVAGLGVALALPHLTAQRTVVSYPAAALALAISALVGILAGLGPANQAAALDPATALRHE